MDFRPITQVGARKVVTGASDRQITPILTSRDPAQRSGVDLAVDNGLSSDWDLASWGSPAGWSITGPAYHTPGTAAALTQNIVTTPGSAYVVYVPANAIVAGTFLIRANSVVIARYDPLAGAAVGAFQAAGATSTITIEPTSEMDGGVSYVRVDQVLQSDNQAAATVQASTPGLGSMWLWAPGETSVALGLYALAEFAYFAGASDRNTAIGESALASMRWGAQNTAVGYSANGTVISANKTTAIGANTQAAHENSVAVGAETETDRVDTVAIGDRDIEIQGAGRGIYMRSPNNTTYLVTVNDDGELAVTPDGF